MLAVLAFAIGASVGSFINVAADRLPKGGSLVSPRSFCESCIRPLNHWDMVPVFSYFWLRGRCRFCRAPIPLRVMLTESVAGLLFVFLYLRYGFGLEFAVICAAVTLMLVVFLIDLEHGLILNRVIYPSFLALLVLAPFWPELGDSRSFPGTSGMLASLLNSLVAGGGAFLLFLIITLAYPKGMGGGDVKLAGLLGLLVGFPGVLIALEIAVVAGGLLAIALVLLGKKGRKDSIPFGPFLAAGSLIAMVIGSEIIAGYRNIAAQLVGAWT